VATLDWVTSDRYKHRRLPAGATLCHEGDFGDTLYLVVQGMLQISKRVIQGADKVIATLGVGQYAGELSLLTGAQRSATMRAVEDTEVIEIDQEAFLQLLHDQPQVGLDLMRQLAHRLHETTEELILTALEVALVQREPSRMQAGSRRMRFIATGSFLSEKTAAVMRLAAAQAPLAKSPALVTSLILPGRTQGALVYIFETDAPSDLLELITPFMGLVQCDISPALEIDATLAAAVVQEEAESGPGDEGKT
jgi:CRP/FNR family cyclic AMP-dependent transcriptional regulator